MVEFFTMEKVVNPTVSKNNLFHQVSSITTFEVVFSHPLGLTEILQTFLLLNTFLTQYKYRTLHKNYQD